MSKTQFFIVKDKPVEWARISLEGELELFDEKLCREAADMYDSDEVNVATATAKLCCLLLDRGDI